MKLKIEDRHIKAAVPADPERCVITLALKDVFPGRRILGDWNRATVYSADWKTSVTYAYDAAGRRLTDDADMLRPLSPCEIELTETR